MHHVWTNDTEVTFKHKLIRFHGFYIIMKLTPNVTNCLFFIDHIWTCILRNIVLASHNRF